MPEASIAEHPFVAGFDPEHIEVLESCLIGRHSWEAGTPILRRGDDADRCHLIVDGTIAIEIRAPGTAPRTILTLHGGELLGWSWLVEPHLWTFDARAVEDSSAFALDAQRLRDEIEDDCGFGLVLITRVTKAIVNRLKATRLQVLDVYNR